MRITFFARKAAETTIEALKSKAAKERIIQELLTPPTGPSAPAWHAMRKKLDTPEHRAWVEKVMSSPTFEEDQRKIAERLGIILEEAARSNSFY